MGIIAGNISFHWMELKYKYITGLVGCIKTKDTVWDDTVLMITSAHTVRFLHFGAGFNIFVEMVANAPEKAGE